MKAKENQGKNCTTKQADARMRNWNKARLKGQFLLNPNLLTYKERWLYNSIRVMVRVLLKDWDNNTKILGFKTRKQDETSK